MSTQQLRYRARQDIAIPNGGVLGHMYQANPFNPSQWILGGEVDHPFRYNSSLCCNVSEKCWDELHKRSKGGLYLDGGPLTLRRFSNEGLRFEPVNVGTYTCGWVRYVGGFACNLSPETVWSHALTLGDDLFSREFSDCADYGATGWSKARPGQPGADLGLFLAELREVPKMLKDTALFFHNSWKSISKGAGSVSKHAANSWLGANFGWLPFISDLRRFAQTTKTLDRSIQQLRRDNGKWVKRRRTVSTVLEDTYDSGWQDGSSYFSPYLTTWFFQGPPYLRSRLSIQKSASFWFEARFRYWIPDIGSYRWKKKAIRKLYGLNLNPSLIWNATPWSWLVDWTSNVGDVLSNLDNNLAENLVAKYAYIMGSQRLIANVESFHNYNPAYCSARDFITHFNLELKERKAASPFGFALTGSDFTSRQWSLLSALGLQRLKF